MRHNVKGRKLGRTSSHRDALLRNLSISLLKHKRITTTLAKAKELRTFIEPILTKAKKGDLHRKKLIMDQLKDKEVVKELFGEISEKIAERQGGYTRVIKRGRRMGDAAEMAIIELVDYNEVANQKAVELKDSREEKKQQKKDKEQTEAQASAEAGK